jgi:hypothetical protein
MAINYYTYLGKDDPIYKNGWTVGGANSPPSQKSRPTNQTQEKFCSQSENIFLDQIALEAREQWSGFDPACVEAFNHQRPEGSPHEVPSL